MLKIGAFVLLMSLGSPTAGYQNDWDGPLYVTCPAGTAFNRVESIHDNGKEDRLWSWECGSSPYSDIRGVQTCTSFIKANSFDDRMDFVCNDGYALTGVSSYHHNNYEDREWTFQCCKPLQKSCTHKNVYTSGYVNEFDKPLDFRTSRLIIGAYSYHDNGKEDRRWKFTTADVECL